MTETIITALITGAITLMGVLISNGKSQAVTETKLEALTLEVREHNNFARRMPVVEEQIKEMKGEVAELKSYHMQPK
jgi:TolA-binding protein